MSRTWFSSELETVTTFWRVLRRDGTAHGFTSHDRDLWFDGILHKASPGMVASAIRKSSGFEPDSAEVEGALSHDTIAAADLAEGRFDGAQIRIGVVDWETGEREILYRGSIGAVVEEEGRFTADLVSRKAELLRDPVPRTSPGCRAAFCGPGCGLSVAFFTHEAVLAAFDLEANSVTMEMDAAPTDLLGGWVRWLDGPQAGVEMDIMALDGLGLVLSAPLDEALGPGLRLVVRQGCDHTLDTCATRFGNAANFQGEPFLPGNDLLTRYPAPLA